MRGTVRHDMPGRAIVAYLATTDAARQHRHICAYMELMHATPPNLTAVTLCNLVKRGYVMKLRRGWYRGCLDLV